MKRLLMRLTSPFRRHQFDVVKGVHSWQAAIEAGHLPAVYMPDGNPYEIADFEFGQLIGRAPTVGLLPQLMVCTRCGMPVFHRNLLDREEFNFFYRLRGCAGHPKKWPPPESGDWGSVPLRSEPLSEDEFRKACERINGSIEE